MAINIAGSITPKPAGVNYNFAIIFGILVVAVLALVLWSRGNTPAPTYKPEELSSAGVSKDWFERTYTPAPHATPVVQPPPLRKPLTISPPQPPPPIRSTTANRAPDLAAQERRRILLGAMTSSMDIKVDGSNTLEISKPDPMQASVSIAPAPPHTLLAWTFVYATLETPINSDHPGDVLARVSHAARDLTQTEVLIPIGSIIHGTQRGASENPNDASLEVVFDDIQFPNGGHMAIPKMDGTNPGGSPGIGGKVDKHLAEKWVPALLTAGITAGMMLATQPSYGNGYNSGYGAEQQAAGGFAQSMGGFATRGMQQDLMNIRRTITVPAGTPIKVLVNKNFTFPNSYED